MCCMNTRDHWSGKGPDGRTICVVNFAAIWNDSEQMGRLGIAWQSLHSIHTWSISLFHSTPLKVALCQWSAYIHNQLKHYSWLYLLTNWPWPLIYITSLNIYFKASNPLSFISSNSQSSLSQAFIMPYKIATVSHNNFKPYHRHLDTFMPIAQFAMGLYRLLPV